MKLIDEDMEVESQAVDWNLKNDVEYPYGDPSKTGPSRLVRGSARVMQLAKWNGVCHCCGRASNMLTGHLRRHTCGRWVYE